MSLKILVADDSPTVQKVIEITLSNSDCELVQISSEEKLFELLDNDRFDLILLDFSLSEGHDGYQLSRSIKEKIPSSKIIAMLTSFDSPKDEDLSEAGIDDIIVKPFDSAEFVQKCYKLTGQGLNNASSGDDEWVVDNPPLAEGAIEFSTEAKIETPRDDDSDGTFSEELKGWGMEVPEIIDGQNESVKIPNQEDLEYPDMGEVAKDNQTPPKLTSLSELVEDEERGEKIEKSNLLQDKLFDREFESLIENDISTEDFWTANIDLENTASGENTVTEDAQEKNMDSNSKKCDDYNEDPGNEIPIINLKHNSKTDTVESIDEDRMVEKLKMALLPVIEETIKSQIKMSIEKIAWDVIPDLAENLIREEIQNLSCDVRK